MLSKEIVRAVEIIPDYRLCDTGLYTNDNNQWALRVLKARWHSRVGDSRNCDTCRWYGFRNEGTARTNTRGIPEKSSRLPCREWPAFGELSCPVDGNYENTSDLYSISLTSHPVLRTLARADSRLAGYIRSCIVRAVEGCPSLSF